MKEVKLFMTTLVPNNIMNQGRLANLPIEHLTRKYGFSEEVLADPFGWVEIDPAMALLKEVGELSKIDNIGFFLGSMPFHSSHWGVGGYALDTAATMDNTFDLILGLSNGNTGDSHVIAGFIKEAETICYYLRHNQGSWDSLPDYIEYWMTLTFHVIQSYAGERLQALEVNFTHPQKGKQEDYEAFFGCHVYGNQPANMLRFPAEWQNIVGPKRDDLLHATLMKLVAYYVRAHTIDRAFTYDVKIALERQLNQNTLPTLDTVAKKIGVSARNIQRKLQAEGSSFSEIWDEVRKNYAIITLKNAEKSITEISQALGYSNVSAFYTAFKRWTEMTPKDFQKQFSKDFFSEKPTQYTISQDSP